MIFYLLWNLNWKDPKLFFFFYALEVGLNFNGSNNGSNLLVCCWELTMIWGGTSSSEDQVELFSLLMIISSFSSLNLSADSGIKMVKKHLEIGKTDPQHWKEIAKFRKEF